MELTHFVLTRFGYVQDEADRTVIKSNVTTRDPLASRAVEQRLKLLETFCLPSILGQTTDAFTWILIVSPRLKARYRTRLRDLVAAHRDAHIVDATPGMELGRLEWLRPYAPHASATHVATTNVDDDDLIGRGLLAYTQRYIREADAEGRLQSCTIIGCSDPQQWDFLPTRRAPFGHIKSYRGRSFPPFTGYTVCCRQPHYDLSALAFRHAITPRYFDPDEQLEGVTQTALRAAADRTGDDWRAWRGERHIHLIPAAPAQVIVGNHLENDQITRLFEGWSTRRPVTGPADFPDMTLDLARVRANIPAFRRSPSALFRHLYRGTWLAITAREWKRRFSILYLLLTWPIWFMVGLPDGEGQ